VSRFFVPVFMQQAWWELAEHRYVDIEDRTAGAGGWSSGGLPQAICGERLQEKDSTWRSSITRRLAEIKVNWRFP
jgi:hypothetical protein